jgi:hypothetical protein
VPLKLNLHQPFGRWKPLFGVKIYLSRCTIPARVARHSKGLFTSSITDHLGQAIDVFDEERAAPLDNPNSG